MAKLLGPFPVACGDLQIPKDSGAIQPPLMRVFYPCLRQGVSRKSRWLPSVQYAFGYLSNIARPYTIVRQSVVWVLAYCLYLFLWPGSAIVADVAKPILTEEGEEEDDLKNKRFPVVVFSHGLWACRTTYSTLCSDFASYGYIVVAPEHLDGSANMACYINDQGQTKWVEHKYANASMQDATMEQRAEQLKHRVKEMEMVMNTIERLNNGAIKSNLITGDLGLNLKMFEGRIDVDRVAIAGHSFGGATAVISPGVFGRFECSLALDVWWEPVEKADYEKLSGKVPVLMLNTEKFDWKTLQEARLVYLNARAAGLKDGKPLETTLMTIKHTRHQDQSDLPLFLPGLCKKLQLSGDLDVQLAKDINSRACLEFLQKYLSVAGKKYPSNFNRVESDYAYLISVPITP